MKEKIIYVFMLLIVIVSCTEEESFDEYGVRILKKNGVVFAMDSRLSLNLDGTNDYMGVRKENVLTFPEGEYDGWRYYVIGNIGAEPNYKIIDDPSIHYTEGIIYADGEVSQKVVPRIFLSIPGEWKFKLVVQNEKKDTIRVSKVENVEVWFPDPLEIEAALSDDMYEAWNETLEDASEMGRREKSFWIYAVAKNGEVSVQRDEIKDGPWIMNSDETAHTDFTAPEIISPLDPLDEAWYPIGFFHTHTPLTYCPPEAHRGVGFSGGDIQAVGAHGIAFYLYDYSADFEEEIYGGHDLHQAAKLYYENREERRPTPKSWADLDTY